MEINNQKHAYEFNKNDLETIISRIQQELNDT